MNLGGRHYVVMVWALRRGTSLGGVLRCRHSRGLQPPALTGL